jgi:DNA topoisomerase-1
MMRKFASLMNDQNIGNITLEETLNLFYPKLGIIKREVEVSNGRYNLIFAMELLVSLPKGEIH